MLRFLSSSQSPPPSPPDGNLPPPGPPEPRRRRGDDVIISKKINDVIIPLSRSFLSLPPPVLQDRIIQLATLIEYLLRSFSTGTAITIWKMSEPQVFDYMQFMEWINGMIMEYSVVTEAKAALKRMRDLLVRFMDLRTPLPPPFHLVVQQVGNDLKFTYQGEPEPAIRVTNLDRDTYVRATQHQMFNDLATATDLARSRFNRGFDDMLLYLREAVHGEDDPFFALTKRIAEYANSVNIPFYYPYATILSYTPALYFLCGFSVYGYQLINMLSPVAQMLTPVTIDFLPADMNFLANLCTPYSHNHVFGPGGCAWLIIGIYDRLLLDIDNHTRYVSPITSLLQSPAYLRIQYTRGDGTSGQWDIQLRPEFSPVYCTDANLVQALLEIERIFDECYTMFNARHVDFYKDEVRESNDHKVVKLSVSLVGVYRRSIRGGQIVSGSNLFWERMLDIPGGRFKGRKANFILFRSFDTLTNKYLHGCVYRALNCSCAKNDDDKVVFCHCPLPETMEGVAIEDIPELVRANGDKYIVFVVIISKKDEDGKSGKNVELLHFGKRYYEGGKVLYISQPDWNKVQGHCALWLPNDEVPNCKDAEYSRFLGYGGYNKVNRILCGSDMPNVCPICGEMYSDANSWAHYVHHSSDLVCHLCGLKYETAEDLNVHCKFHCKKLPEFSAIMLKDDDIVYHEPSPSEWINVYADLESAITDPDAEGNREHVNILIGWVDDYNKQVQIKKRINDFFNEIAKLPATDIRIYFHNGEGYDFHFIIRDLCECRKGFVKNFSVVGDSGQKIRFFSVDYRGKHLHFRDTFAFVSESLEKWVKSSKESGCKFEMFRSTFDDYKQSILLRKNPFPYNAILGADDLKKSVDEMIAWATCDKAEEIFCYKMSKEELISFAEWLVTNKEKCKWKTVGDYYEDYLRCDVSQLCDIMRHFEANVYEEYGLNVHDFYGTPSLTWAAWLKQNKFPLEPITSSKHYDVINSCIRGGQTGVMTRLYDSEKEGGAMFDLDINSLYATVMLKFDFPCHDWKEEEIPLTKDILKFLKELHANGRSAFVELDMVVKENEAYEDYVPVASKRRIKGCYNYHAMEFYQTENPDCMFFSGLTQVYGKHEHYCCHSRNLIWYIEHDVIEIEQIWFILSGKDEPVFREYVQHNLDKRAEFNDDPIKKMLYKLLNNSLYGKTYEDETQRAEYCIEAVDKVNTSDIFKVRRAITQMGEWILYEATKKVFKVNKPVYLGACITEFSKLWMYQMYYDKIRPHFPDCRVYYTDTDAITIFFPTMVRTLLDVAEELNTDEEQIIDTSNFDTLPKETRHIRMNKQPGLFKSETGEHRILKFIGLRAKTYIMVCEDDFVKMSVKGCPLAEKAKLKWDDFYEVLFSPGEGKVLEYDAIRSKYHHVRSVRLRRIVLSADDRKRYITDDLIHTFPLFSSQHQAAIKYKNPLHQ